MYLNYTPMSHPPKTIRLLIADDQPVILRGLSLMLGSEDDIEVVGLANDGVEAVAMARELRPDVIIMDLQMPRLTGVEATRAIMLDSTDVKVVVLTTFATDTLVTDAIHAGALAYLLKDTAEADVLATVRAAYNGESVPKADLSGQVTH